MKSFVLPPWRKKIIEKQNRVKDSLVDKTVKAMADVLKQGLDEIFLHYEKTGMYAEPTLSGIFNVSSAFYESVLKHAIEQGHVSKHAQAGKKRMGKGPPKQPVKFDDIHQVLRNKTYWRRVMARSKKMSERLRREYLKKIRKQFHDIMPLIQSGEITPAEAKKKLEEKWQTTKPRIETIFRTETTNYFAQTQVKFFEDDPEIIGFLFDSVRDVSRTEICKSRHGLVYRPNTKLLRKNTPALHFNCRSDLIALANTPDNQKMLNDPSRDPARKSVVPIDQKWRK